MTAFSRHAARMRACAQAGLSVAHEGATYVQATPTAVQRLRARTLGYRRAGLCADAGGRASAAARQLLSALGGRRHDLVRDAAPRCGRAGVRRVLAAALAHAGARSAETRGRI